MGKRKLIGPGANGHRITDLWDTSHQKIMVAWNGPGPPKKSHVAAPVRQYAVEFFVSVRMGVSICRLTETNRGPQSKWLHDIS